METKKTRLQEQHKMDIEKIKITLKSERQKEELTFKRSALFKCAELAAQSYEIFDNISLDLSARKLNVNRHTEYMHQLNKLKVENGGGLIVSYHNFFVIIRDFFVKIEAFIHIVAMENDTRRLLYLLRIKDKKELFVIMWKKLVEEEGLLISIVSDPKFSPPFSEYDWYLKVTNDQLDELKTLRTNLVSYSVCGNLLTEKYKQLTQEISTEGKLLSQMMAESI